MLLFFSIWLQIRLTRFGVCLRKNTRDKQLSPDQQKSTRDTCVHVAQSLSADRSTNFIPVTVALIIFLVAIGAAFDENAAKALWLNNNVATHTIAFTALYFATFPAVFLSTIMGVSQQQAAIPHLLNRLHTDVEKHTQLSRRFGCWKRRASGGIYS